MNEFLNSFELIMQTIANQSVNRAFHSIGSNVFFEFGADVEVTFPNGRKSLSREWIIGINDASWRITKHEKYVVGSGESPELMKTTIQHLFGKRFLSYQFHSQFLDVSFNFEGDYQISTFFNWMAGHQWTMHIPNKAYIEIDCANKDKIQNVRALSTHFPIVDTYKKIDILLNDVAIRKITYDKNDMPTLHCEDNVSIYLKSCAWRLEKDNDYCIGCLDVDKSKIKIELSALIGKKLRQIDVANTMMDARFQFDNQYVLKTFTCCQATRQWEIASKKAVLFSANIPISDS